MKPNPERERWSGRVDFAAGRLSYTAPNRTGWSIDPAEIRLIAEETIEAWGGDWWIHFALESSWVRFPVYAAGFQEVWDRLADTFPGMELGLASSTSFKSRVLWPQSLRGQPLFDYQPERDPPWWRRLLSLGRIESSPTPAVSGYLDATNASTNSPPADRESSGGDTGGEQPDK